MADRPTPSVPVPDPDTLARLRQDLQDAGYTVEGLQDLLGPLASAALHREQPLAADRVTADCETDPDAGGVATLVRCFVLGRPVSAAAIDAALPRSGTSGLRALGLVRGTDRPVGSRPFGERVAVVATCDLRPYGDESHTWWVVSDQSELARGGPLPTDHVLGLGGATTTLASWTPRPQVERALDLGTGSGVQALHLAGHTADPVVATDLSTRALGFAAVTAALSGVDLDLRCGSLLEPVAGERFDLVVSNPPFVITPRRDGVPRYEYRDGGASGDALVALSLIHI